MEKIKVSDIEYSYKSDVSCEGGNKELGHPKVYLKIDKEKKEIICPYCSKKFILK